MEGEVNLFLIVLAGFVASASPGPATLAIAGTSMERGRPAGLAIALGILTGSMTWSVAAAAGVGALMLVNVWVFEVVRYIGAAYLLYLAWGAAKGAVSTKDLATRNVKGSLRSVYLKGYLLHLTNPKAILFFGSLYTIGVPPGSPVLELLKVMAAVASMSIFVFTSYAFLFSTPLATRVYLKTRRWFQAAFAVGFAAAGIKILTARLPS